jgi:hypothetical protein
VQWIPLWVGELAGPANPRAKALAMVIVSVGACASTFVAPLLLAGLRRRLGYQLLCAFALVATVCDLPHAGGLVGRDVVRHLPSGDGPEGLHARHGRHGLLRFLPALPAGTVPDPRPRDEQGICYDAGRLVAVPFVLLSGKLVEGLGGYQQAAAAITLVYAVGLFVAFLGKELPVRRSRD